MRIGDTHLGYCTNVHPGETLSAVLGNLEQHTTAVKALFAPHTPMAVGLWLSHAAALELDQSKGRMDALSQRLDELGLYVPTLNGFPLGAFHGQRVKERVYEPDWRSDARREHTVRLAYVLARLLPAGEHGSISTLPGGFKPVLTAQDAPVIRGQLVRTVAELHALEASTGRRIVLALEPEPCCMLETIAETVAFFDEHLRSEAAVAQLADLAGLSRADAASALEQQIGVCLDACHAAVEHEDAGEVVAQLERAQIPIAKIQLSVGLRVPHADAAARAALGAFAEDVYLHQVVARDGDRLQRFVDLPEALASPLADSSSALAPEWRVHFHVPVFAKQLYGPFETTQPFLDQLLALHARRPLTAHLEVETYTWGVLPEALRAPSLPRAIHRELAYCRERLTPAPERAL